ncbi:T9SS type A sorting domain-containing protein [Epilithonimonas sp. JDS]|uniref:T9SS type A sorting domain-containing protein n=1 Tax=Epilithonimonas sp. JDS TaxID=2902797 RepID=UPI001E398D71|nr:T9SS type A sorting domain-containing protein [Epilithonimonas sp. JDS]MCD9854484.1 T9SS type A sorting domain-containing protein [Epilithonimonas sp. JDS]
MKKINLMVMLFISAVTYAQTFSIYTENSTIGAGVNSLRFSNGSGFTLSEPGTATYEGNKNLLLTYNGTSSYFHAIMFPRNAANTSDVVLDLSAYSYYNLAIKTASPHPFYIRMRGNNVIAKVLINPSSNSYNFTNDNQWHFMSIPLSAFIPESSSFSLSNVSEIFVLRSENTISTVVGSSNNFQVDNIYLSATSALSVMSGEKNKPLSIFPNPASSKITITSDQKMDKISIYDSTGKRAIVTDSGGKTSLIDISKLSKGTYIISVESKAKITSSKFIKK